MSVCTASSDMCMLSCSNHQQLPGASAPGTAAPSAAQQHADSQAQRSAHAHTSALRCGQPRAHCVSLPPPRSLAKIVSSANFAANSSVELPGCKSAHASIGTHRLEMYAFVYVCSTWPIGFVSRQQFLEKGGLYNRVTGCQSACSMMVCHLHRMG